MATESGETVTTESGGTVATESGGTVATESGGAGTTGDEMVATVSDEAAATGRIMYADEGPYTIDVRDGGDDYRSGGWDRVRRERDRGRDRRSQRRDPRACHATYHKNFILLSKKIYLPTDFHHFCCKKFSNKQAINAIKNINKIFYKTIWILTFFS